MSTVPSTFNCFDVLKFRQMRLQIQQVAVLIQYQLGLKYIFYFLGIQKRLLTPQRCHRNGGHPAKEEKNKSFHNSDLGT